MKVTWPLQWTGYALEVHLLYKLHIRGNMQVETNYITYAPNRTSSANAFDYNNFEQADEQLLKNLLMARVHAFLFRKP